MPKIAIDRKTQKLTQAKAPVVLKDDELDNVKGAHGGVEQQGVRQVQGVAPVGAAVLNKKPVAQNKLNLNKAVSDNESAF